MRTGQIQTACAWVWCGLMVSLAGVGQAAEARPSFTYTGFRYIEVLGLQEPLEIEEVDGFDLHTVSSRIGALTTDNARLNRVLRACQDTLELITARRHGIWWHSMTTRARSSRLFPG